MGKCLVTRLGAHVNNSSLLRAGEMRITCSKIDSPSSKTQGFTLQCCKETKLEIIGDGYFTDNTLQKNLGKTMMIPASNESAQSYTNFYTSNGNYDIAILDKYSIVTLYLYASGLSVSSKDTKHKSICIDDLKYSTNLKSLWVLSSSVSGDISALANLTNLVVAFINSPQVSGDISALANLTNLTNISLSNTNISGDISALANLTNLTNISLSNTNISGDISALANLTNLTNIELLSMSGDIGSINGLNKLKEIRSQSSSLTGDLATLPSSCYFISLLSKKNNTFTWGNRTSSSNIVAIEGNPFISNVDKMLQDQSLGVVAFPSSGEAFYKGIKVVGTRTSASDAAVAKLQSKGYTVSITPE